MLLKEIRYENGEGSVKLWDDFVELGRGQELVDAASAVILEAWYRTEEKENLPDPKGDGSGKNLSK